MPAVRFALPWLDCAFSFYMSDSTERLSERWQEMMAQDDIIFARADIVKCAGI